MSGVWRWIRKLSKTDDEPPQTRLTREQAMAIARRHLMGNDELFRPGARATVENGRIIWRVITHVGHRGGHSQIQIDDETGAVIETHHVDH